MFQGSHSIPKKDNKNVASMNTIRTGVSVEDTPWQRIKTVGGVIFFFHFVGLGFLIKEGLKSNSFFGWLPFHKFYLKIFYLGVGLVVGGSHHDKNGDLFRTRSHNGDLFKTRSHNNFDNQNKVAHLVTWVPHFA